MRRRSCAETALLCRGRMGHVGWVIAPGSWARVAEIWQAHPAPLQLRFGDYCEEMDMEDINEMKVYVPTDMLDREASDEPTLGSDAPLRRRG